MSVSCAILGWRPQFYQNSENGFVTTEASRASCELIFYASESCVRALSGACRFILHFAILRHKNAKTFHTPENIRLDNAFLKMHVLLRFKQFFGPGKFFKVFLQRFASTEPSRASCELIFGASESWDRWLSGAYRFIPQFAILRRKMGYWIGTYFQNSVFHGLGFRVCAPKKRFPRFRVCAPKKRFPGFRV